MKGIENMLKEEEERLQKIQSAVRLRLSTAPEGTLRISSTGKYPQFMLCTDENQQTKRQGKYIKKCEEDTIKALAQKAYDKRLERIVTRRLNQLKALCREYKDNEIEEIYDSYCDVRKQLVVPAEPSWEQRVAEWKRNPYVGKGFANGTVEIYTKKGERVRSKTEKILADTFLQMGIEYKYECPLNLKDYGTVFPDFTILSKKTGKEIYWEHDGKMDDPDYADSAIRKIDSYIKNGIFPGDRLIITYETSKFILNDDTIKALIYKFLI